MKIDVYDDDCKLLTSTFASCVPRKGEEISVFSTSGRSIMSKIVYKVEWHVSEEKMECDVHVTTLENYYKFCASK